MPRTNNPAPGVTDVLVASAARTTSSTSAALSGYGASTTLRVQVDVTAASGTAPTLDVVIQDSLDGTTFNTIGTFAQKTAASREVINITVPFSETLRVSWTVTGTTPSFTFAVVAYTE